MSNLFDESEPEEEPPTDEEQDAIDQFEIDHHEAMIDDFDGYE